MMRILLAQKLPYVPAFSGASKMGKMLLEGLAERGHSCRVVALMSPQKRSLQQKNSLVDVAVQGMVKSNSPSGVEVFTLNGVEVHAVSDGYRITMYLMEQVKSFSPTWTLISEDPTYQILSAALELSPQRTIFLSQSQATLPFGPESFSPDSFKTQMLKRVAEILAISHYLRDYIKRWGALHSALIPLPIYGKGPFPHLASFANSYVTMINPSGIKGLPILLELAHRLPEIQFAAVPSWATTADDRARLERAPNVRLLEPTEDIDSIFAKTRVLVVPSLWGEAFGMVVVEAMLRGIPVLASNVGGLPEAKLGVDYLLPVRPIERYQNHRDDKLLPVPEIPCQDIGPWLKALQSLLYDPPHYSQVSGASRRAALGYVSTLSITAIEDYLENLGPAQVVSEHQQSKTNDDILESLTTLSSEKLELLARFLDRKKEQTRT